MNFQSTYVYRCGHCSDFMTIRSNDPLERTNMDEQKCSKCGCPKLLRQVRVGGRLVDFNVRIHKK